MDFSKFLLGLLVLAGMIIVGWLAILTFPLSLFLVIAYGAIKAIIDYSRRQ